VLVGTGLKWERISMISSNGSLRRSKPLFGKAGAPAAFTLTAARGECLTLVFEFNGILGEYQGSIMGECSVCPLLTIHDIFKIAHPRRPGGVSQSNATQPNSSSNKYEGQENIHECHKY
jgi:hypothetical protein